MRTHYNPLRKWQATIKRDRTAIDGRFSVNYRTLCRRNNRLEMARQLSQKNLTFKLVLLLDAVSPEPLRMIVDDDKFDEATFLYEIHLGKLDMPLEVLRSMSDEEMQERAISTRNSQISPEYFQSADLNLLRNVFQAGSKAYLGYRPPIVKAHDFSVEAISKAPETDNDSRESHEAEIVLVVDAVSGFNAAKVFKPGE